MVTIKECQSRLEEVAKAMTEATGYSITASMVKALASEEVRVKHIYVVHYLDNPDNEITILAQYSSNNILNVRTVFWPKEK